MTKTISETNGFEIYFFFAVVGLFFSGLWVATTGQLLKQINWLSGVSILVIVGAIIILSRNWSSSNAPIKSLVIITVLYAGLTCVGRFVILQEIPPAFVGFTLIQGSSLGFLFAVFSQPMLPTKLYNKTGNSDKNISDPKKRRSALNLHLKIQWKIGQIVLTIIVITVGGLLVWTFPRGGSKIAREKMAITSLPLVATLGPVLLYVLRKIFLIEQQVMESLNEKE